MLHCPLHLVFVLGRIHGGEHRALLNYIHYVYYKLILYNRAYIYTHVNVLIRYCVATYIGE